MKSNKPNIQKIKALAKEQGLSQKFICDCLGKRRTFLSEVGLGNGKITQEELEIIANKLNTTVEYLTDQTEQKEKLVDQMTDEQLDNALIHLLSGLTADDIKKS